MPTTTTPAAPAASHVPDSRGPVSHVPPSRGQISRGQVRGGWWPAAAALGLVLAGTAGCGLIGGDPFDPQRADVAQRRAAADQQVGELTDRLAAGRRSLGRAGTDSCEAGQDNWKVTEDFSYRCRTSQTVAYAGGGLDTVVPDLQQRFDELGCDADVAGDVELGLPPDAGQPGPGDADFQVGELQPGPFALCGAEQEVRVTLLNPEHPDVVGLTEASWRSYDELLVSATPPTPATVQAIVDSPPSEVVVLITVEAGYHTEPRNR